MCSPEMITNKCGKSIFYQTIIVIFFYPKPEINQMNVFFNDQLTESAKIKDIYQSYRQSTNVLYSKIKAYAERQQQL